MKRLVAVGACYLDIILTVPYYPTEDEKLRSHTLVRRRGGNCPNTLEILQQLIANLIDEVPPSASGGSHVPSSALDSEQEPLSLQAGSSAAGKATATSTESTPANERPVLALCTVLPAKNTDAVQTVDASFRPTTTSLPQSSASRSDSKTRTEDSKKRDESTKAGSKFHATDSSSAAPSDTTDTLFPATPKPADPGAQQHPDVVPIDMTPCIYRPGHTEAAASYIIKSLASDSRTIVNYQPLPEMTLEEFIVVTDYTRSPPSSSDDTVWYHFEGRIPETTLACIQYLRVAHAQSPLPQTPSSSSPPSLPSKLKISVEIEKPGREGLAELAAAADVVFYAKGWALGKGFDSAEACLRAQAALYLRAELLCCTWGSEGAWALERRRSKNSLPHQQGEERSGGRRQYGDQDHESALPLTLGREEERGLGKDIGDDDRERVTDPEPIAIQHGPAFTGISPQASTTSTTASAIDEDIEHDITTTTAPAPAPAPAPVVDAVGAGDTFTAGMLFGLMCHGDDTDGKAFWSLERRLRFANELAGRKVRQEGFVGLGRAMEHWR